MPRPRMPPTPLSSADISAKETFTVTDLESVFALPPPAIQAAGDKSNVSKSYLQTTATKRSSPPSSPKASRTTSSLQRKRTLSGTNKSRSDVSPALSVMEQTNTLPPPPTRTRKIIQMKPKQTANASTEQCSPAAAASTSSTKEATAPSTQVSKRKSGQPSATSAAGRKIARKTAHSIIERRRRSKMNEEFGVLKDMIPACAGVEMHKLAILQAGIEYVRYLEGCIEKLKGQNSVSQPQKGSPIRETGEDEDCEECDESMDLDQDTQRVRYQDVSTASAVSESDVSSPSSAVKMHVPESQHSLPSLSQASVTTSATNSTYASPSLRPIQSSSSISNFLAGYIPRPQVSTSYQPQHQSVYSTAPPQIMTHTPTPTGASPALGALHFSPDLSRTSAWSSINANTASGKPLPNVLPLPQAALPLATPTTNIGPGQSNGKPYGVGEASTGGDHAEATATAALLMMTKDRRGSVGIVPTSSSKGMSVRDLLSS